MHGVRYSSEYLERKKKTASSYGKDLALIEMLDEEMPSDIPSDIAAAFQKDARLRKQTKINFSDPLCETEVPIEVDAEARPAPRVVANDEYQAMVSLRLIAFPGVQWSEVSGPNTPSYVFEDTFSESTHRFHYKCRVELTFQGSTFVGSSGDIPYPSKKGLSGAKIAAEYDLMLQWTKGKSIFEALEDAKVSQSAIIKQKKQYADRNKVLRSLIPPAKRRKIEVIDLPSDEAGPSHLEQILFFLDAIKSLFPSESNGDIYGQSNKFDVSITLGFFDGTQFMSLAPIPGIASFEIRDEFTKTEIKFWRFDAEIWLTNLMTCLDDAILLQLNVNEISAGAVMYLSLKRNPKLFISGSAGKKRICDFYGQNNLWQDISAIRVEFNGVRSNFLECMVPLAENGLLRINEEPARSVGDARGCEDWRVWVPSSQLLLEPYKRLPFAITFQLACLITQRQLLRRELNQELLECMSSMDGAGASNNLFSSLYLSVVEFRNKQGQVRSTTLLDWLRRKSATNTSHPPIQGNVFWVPHLVITPTRVICRGVLPEVGNRMLRHFSQASSQLAFLRVSFRDESGKLSKTVYGEIANRLKTIFEEGIRIPLSGRHYQFLMFSASQLRQHKAWFFWSDPAVGLPTAADVRKWVGALDNIRIPSKFASRLGLVISSSVAAMRLPNDKVSVGLVPDIEEHGCVFSDGIGAISISLAKKISRKIGLTYVPSCFQIRYAGVKGLVAIHPDLGERDVARFRRSMVKFESAHDILEVLNWSKPQAAYLNRQVIAILSGRGVPDDVMLRRQAEHIINEVELSLGAPRLWPGRCIRSEMASRVRTLLQHGFDARRDPYIQTALHAIQFSKVAELKQHCRIPLRPEEGRYLLGVLDEYRILKYGQVFISTSSNIDDPLSPCRVIKGAVTVSRSPCLHPGDLRVLEAVDVPQLHHLTNCIVFPQQGIRSHPSECSGGDLDGDLYLCMWAPDLIPTGENRVVPPAPIASNGLVPVDGDRISVSDIAGFFMHYVQNDYLGPLADAWVRLFPHLMMNGP
jgi:hypothetical protein